jgi:hypothetical protein
MPESCDSRIVPPRNRTDGAKSNATPYAANAKNLSLILSYLATPAPNLYQQAVKRRVAIR